jgi:threonyl-tRNA synthetase
MAPEQVRILTLNDNVADYAKEVEDVVKSIGLRFFGKTYSVRYTVDDRNESLGKKIREATKMKIPMVLIVGPKDAEAKQVSIRWSESGEEGKVELSSLREYLIENIERTFYTDKEFFGLEDE